MSGALALEGVSVRVAGRTLLDGVSAQVAPGEIVGLLGPNGAGKTTLLRVASGVLAPSAGCVRLAGAPLQELGPRAVAKRLAVVPQDTHVAFPFRVDEMVMMGRAPHLGPFALDGAADADRVEAALRRMALLDLADRAVPSLSGGERQLVLFARALVQEPEWLLLDEPTAFLDLRHRLRLLAVVRELARRGRGSLVVSHDLGLAARTCDRLLLLHEGRLVAQGSPAEVLTPERLRDVYGIEARVVTTPEGALAVAPLAPISPED
ncbi:MAG: heme ABC transporter ATP-binding protein [Proteobacteria bacterium]|nr:heme ABC transporter ATP-binding protein [Pseudomonadota bacterium]